ncbi:hypothetical protein BDN72DRAFT_140874 [Pluteus cervinus]|uniref:Uncharacterized protein n=1 Tax=Pluteus cervinus TaxID=181527 RepID=A0ACD3ALN2_9AGAR|nr:hypothetical protein BDN72DRAFT_140874 [Pluteus cervinus]
MHVVPETDYWDDEEEIPPEVLIPNDREERSMSIGEGEEMGRVVVEALMNRFFEDPASVVKNKGKGRARTAGPSGSQKRGDAGDGEEQGRNKRMKVDWLDVNSRVKLRSKAYDKLCVHHLIQSFPDLSQTVIWQAIQAKQGFYAPAHFYLLELTQQPGVDKGNTSAKTKKAKRRRPRGTTKAKGKGKARAVQFEDEDNGEPVSVPPLNRIVEDQLGIDEYDELFEEERLWVTEEQARRDNNVAQQVNEEEYEHAGAKIECGCCFDEFPFDKMIQCPEAHLFCMSCITQLASTSIVTPMGPAAASSSSGSAVPALVVCPTIGDTPCNLPFTASELKRALPDTLYQKWERECQRREVDAAEVDGMEECPFCDWRCIMTLAFEEEKLFRCGNDDGGCGVVSCRKCQKPDHLPKSCDEVSEDRILDGRHVIEEAMSQALMRNCPKCKKAFIKENGCNKMTCPHCATISCYVCREVIQGYEHFSGHGPGQGRGNKCPLHDAPTGYNHEAEVERARQDAIREYKRNNPDASIEEINEGIIKGPEPARPAPGQNLFGLGGINFMGINPPGAAAYGHIGMQIQYPPPAVFGLPPPYIPPVPPPVPDAHGRFMQAHIRAHNAHMQQHHMLDQMAIRQQMVRLPPLPQNIPQRKRRTRRK